MGELLKIEGFRRELAVAETYDDIKILDTKASVAAEIAKKQKIAKGKQDELGIFRVEIEAKKGGWLKEMFPKGGDRKSNSTKSSLISIKDAGISFDESANARLVHTAKEDEPEFLKDVVEEIMNNETQVVTPSAVAKAIRKKKKEKAKDEKKKDFEVISKTYTDKDIQIYFEEFQLGCERMDDNSVDAIITDPPYPIEYIGLWEDMFRIAERILKPSAFLVAYGNHQNLDRIFQLPNPLKYYWTFKLDFTAKPIAMGRNLIATWKPVLVYQKMPFKKIEETIEDCVKESKPFNYNERDLHDKNWAQSLGKFEYLIEKFTNPGELVVEPFAGTGTTLVAAKNTKRKCIGFEIEQEKYEGIIKGRIMKGI